MVLSSRSLQITNSSDSPPSKVQFSISLNRGVAPLFAAVPVQVDPHLGKRQCSRCSQPFPCWPYPRWRHERNGRFCIQCCKRSCASCISTKASGDCLSKWPNLTASVPGHYHQWLELIVRTIYKAVKDELWLIGQIVMRRNHIVMPENLWKQTIVLAHEGLQGMVRTKARLQEKVWWPQTDKQVEELIRACYSCQLVGRKQMLNMWLSLWNYLQNTWITRNCS